MINDIVRSTVLFWRNRNPGWSNLCDSHVRTRLSRLTCKRDSIQIARIRVQTANLYFNRSVRINLYASQLLQLTQLTRLSSLQSSVFCGISYWDKGKLSYTCITHELATSLAQ